MSRRPLDLYESNALQTKALLKLVPIRGRVTECCAGPGAMARTLAASSLITRVITNDIDTQHPCHYHSDATKPEAIIWTEPADWIVTCPPFSAAALILPLAFALARDGVAFLLRLSYLEPCENRAEWLDDHAADFHGLFPFGLPRPSYTERGADPVTTAWMVWTKRPAERRCWPAYSPIYRWKNGRV